MTYKTITVDVDVDVDLDEFSDSELIVEMNDRGFSVTPEPVEKFDKFDWDYLIGLVDKDEQTLYNSQVRDKLMNQRWVPK